MADGGAVVSNQSVSETSPEEMREWSLRWRVQAERYIAGEENNATRLINGNSIKALSQAIIAYDDLVRLLLGRSQTGKADG